MQSDFFGGLGPQVDPHSLYQSRRKDLIESIKNTEGYTHNDNNLIVLWAALEGGHERLRQDKSFYYYTGLNEPGVVLTLAMNGKSTLYIPHYFEKRSQWMVIQEALLQKDAKGLGLDAIEYLGKECSGYMLYPFFSSHDYEYMIALLQNTVSAEGRIYTTSPQNGYEYISTRSVLCHLQQCIPGLQGAVSDISSLIAMSRRHKDISEIEKIYRAIEVTELAHESAVQTVKHGALEAEIQASLEYIMTAAHARPAFPSIVASGKNGTVLHYNENKGALKDGELVVIDIGAELENYCADLTRTYPVSGSFTKRQKELYTLVLETQTYVAEQAKPGIWLKNPDKPDQSLHHLAYKFLEKRGYAKYFPHGIGHYLGLDVHDVGSYSEPLHEGDVITIEPGIYIPEESIGIRIEDNYWITKNGSVCLSENLPKEVEDIEMFMQQIAQGEDAQEGGDDNEYDEYDDEDDDYH